MHNLNFVGAQLDSPRPTETPNRPTRTEESSFKRHFDREVDQSNEAHQARSENRARPDKNETGTNGQNDGQSTVAASRESSKVEHTDTRAIGESSEASRSELNEESENGDVVPIVESSSAGMPLQSPDVESLTIPNGSPIADPLLNQRYLTQLKQSDVLNEPDVALARTQLSNQLSAEEPLFATIAQPAVGNASLFGPAASAFVSKVQVNGEAKDAGLNLTTKIVTSSLSQSINDSTDSVESLASGLLATKRGLTISPEMKPLELGLQSGAVNSSLLMSESTLSSSFATTLSEQTGITSSGALTDKPLGLQALGQLGTPARFTVNVEFGRAEWNSNVAAKVAQMAAQNLNFAEIQLDPPELGPLQVRVQVNSDQASVSFTAQSAQVRDALEQGNQRLRDMLEAEGMNLVDVDVSDQQQQQNKDELDSDNADEKHISSSEDKDQSLVETHTNSAVLDAGVDDFV